MTSFVWSHWKVKTSIGYLQALYITEHKFPHLETYAVPFLLYSLTEQTCLLINLKLLVVSSELVLQWIKGSEVTNLVFKSAPLYTSFMTLKLSLSSVKREL